MSSGGRPVVEVVTGQPGAGKSYTVVSWLIDLYNGGYKGTVWTNLPLIAEKWVRCSIKQLPIEEWLQSAETWEERKKEVKKAEKKRKKARESVQDDEASFDEPDDMDYVGQRRAEVGGPWQLSMEDGDLLVVDEAHTVIPSVGLVEYRKEWQRFLSEVRHQGVTVILISQDTELMDRRCLLLAEQRTTVVNRGKLLHPLFGCQSHYWYSLVHAFTGKPWFVFQRDVFLKYNGKWIRQRSEPVIANLFVFSAYVSRSKSYSSGKGAGEYKRPDKRAALKAFLWAAWFGLLCRVVVVSFLVYLLFGGGGTLFRLVFGRGENVASVSERVEVVPEASQSSSGDQASEVQRDFLRDLAVNMSARGLVLEHCEPVPSCEFRTDGEIRRLYRVKKIGNRVWLSPRNSGRGDAVGRGFQSGFGAARQGYSSLWSTSRP